MESLFSFDNGWKLENGGSHQISKAQTMYDETGASQGEMKSWIWLRNGWK